MAGLRLFANRNDVDVPASGDRTVVQLVAGADVGGVCPGLLLRGDKTDPALPLCRIRLVRQTTAGTASTTVTPGKVFPDLLRADGSAWNPKFRCYTDFSAEPTLGDVLRDDLISPAGTYRFGLVPDLRPGERIGVVITGNGSGAWKVSWSADLGE